MATLTAGQAEVVYQAGQADKVCLIALQDVNTGDVLDVGPNGIGQLRMINRGVCMGVTSFVEIAANFTGTVVTLPSGLASDAAYLLLWGSGE